MRDFAVGAAAPLATVALTPGGWMVPAVSVSSLVFLAVLGGRASGCHIELHDVRLVAGATIDAAAINRITLAALSDRFAWIVSKASQIT